MNKEKALDEPEVFQVALSLVPAAEAFARRHQLTADIAKEVMIEAAKRVVESRRSQDSAPGKPIKNLPAYMFSIARNLMFHELKRRRNEVSLEEHHAPTIDNTASLETHILATEIVRRMPPRARKIFRYRTLGYDYDDIAREFKNMGYHTTTARLRSEFSKATKQIIKELNP